MARRSGNYLTKQFLEEYPIWSAEWLRECFRAMDEKHNAFLYSLYWNNELQRLELIFEKKEEESFDEKDSS